MDSTDTEDGVPLEHGRRVRLRPRGAIPRGDAMAFWSSGRVKDVPLFWPPVAEQPPWVWMPTASPVLSQITGEPELPPVVSAVYCTVVLVLVTSAPVWVCCVWLNWSRGLVTP